MTSDGPAHRSYEVLEHTADVGLRVYGSSLPELFANAAMGLVALAVEPENIQELSVLPLSATGSDAEQLLVNWLSEILYRMDAEGWIFRSFSVGDCSSTAINGKGRGEHREVSARTRSVAVKAVTYHQLSVRETAKGWEATVYFDI